MEDTIGVGRMVKYIIEGGQQTIGILSEKSNN